MAGFNRRRRRLWQVPVFILGLAAVVGVCLARPPWRPVEAFRAERDLAGYRQLLDQSDLDRDRLLAAVERLEANLKLLPHRSADIHLLLGGYYLRLAGNGSVGESLEAARRARAHLDEAQTLGVPVADRPTLTYRLGKSLYLSHGDPRTVIDLLSRSLEKGADDAFDGYGTLAQAYLRLPEPDLQAALSATEKQLQLPNDKDDLLAPVRLLRGELLLRLKNPVEARHVLANIGSRAPLPIQAEARFLRARSFQDEERWEDAAVLWKEILADTRQAPREPGWVLFFLGVCYRQLDQRDDAARTWAECAQRIDGGDEGVAASLGLAELRLLDRSPEMVAAFERAVRDVKEPADWRNTLVGLDQACGLFERASNMLREAGDGERAMRLARLYEKIAVPGAAQFLYAQAAEVAAQAKQGDDASALFRKAGEAYELSAERAAALSDRLQRLRRSAESYRRGNDPRRAVTVLERFLNAETDLKRMGEAWFWLGEAHRELKNQAVAVTAYKACIKYLHQTPLAFRAFYQLALAEIANRDIDSAVDILEQNLQMLAFDREPDAEEKTLYTLADLHFQRHDHRRAVTRLEQALRSYPESPLAVRGLHQLAESYRELAGQQDNGPRLGGLGPLDIVRHKEQRWRENLTLAADNYEKLIGVLDQRPPEGLTPEEREFYRQALFGTAEARFILDQYDAAISLYERMARHNPGRYEEIYALGRISACYFRQREEARGRATLNRARTALEVMTDDAFKNQPFTRLEWEGYLNGAARPITDPALKPQGTGIRVP